jgi:hypothetical protein
MLKVVFFDFGNVIVRVNIQPLSPGLRTISVFRKLWCWNHLYWNSKSGLKRVTLVLKNI